MENLLKHRKNIYSQNGEDGIVGELFKQIGVVNFTCCEFGAWDGIHLSNCKNLIDNNWTAVMIEADQSRYEQLQKTYHGNEQVSLINALVDNNKNSLKSLFSQHGLSLQLDFLSIDIDGLDYEIFEGLDMHPRIICIEVNSGHNPNNGVRIPREIALSNVGQSLSIFCEIAQKKGYKLVAYNGNAFFCLREADLDNRLQELLPTTAYMQFLNSLNEKHKIWLYRVNKADVNPWYRFHNPYLSGASLGIPIIEMLKINILIIPRKISRWLRKK